MIDIIIKLILIFLIIFTPIAFGAVELWAFSIMELGILLIITLWSIQSAISTLRSPSVAGAKDGRVPQSSFPLTSEKSFDSAFRIRHFTFIIVLLSLFLLLILFQMLPLPAGLVKILSPKTYTLRQTLSISNFEPSALSSQPSSVPQSLPSVAPVAPERRMGGFLNPHFSISFFPFLTQIEFFKWLTLIGLFIFLLSWKSLEWRGRTTKHIIIAVMMVSVFESLYGIFEFFSGHLHILHLDGSALISSVTGTFINRNYFAGYLLMVIPLSIGFLFSRETAQAGRFRGWRERLISLDGKMLLIGFSVIVMILGLFFSASRMGILSLLLSFSLITLLLRNPKKGKWFSKTVVLIFGLALLWAAWIGLDAVISRFFTTTEDFKFRWAMWVSTFQIFKDFPIFGSGLGTFIQVFPMYRSLHIQGLATHAENDYLQLSSDVGLLGSGLLLVTFLFLFLKGVSRVRSMSSEEPGRYMAIGGLVGILALMFHSLVERNIQVPSNAFLYTILWAIVLKIPLGPRRLLSH